MSYKHIKKSQQKPKKSHVIATDLITGKRFKEIIDAVVEKTDLTTRDSYVYGYSLLHTQQELASLIHLWPLTTKGHAELQPDCAAIAMHVFADENVLLTAALSTDNLCTLFFAAKTLAPHSRAYAIIKQRLFDSLWEQRDYEKMERILKSSKEAFSNVLVENLSKLDFFQPRKKLLGNIPAFVGHVLTGGGCLILREPLYHADIGDAVGLLANEIKLLFADHAAKNNAISWGQALFDSFVDHEASVLTHVLQLAVKDKPSNLTIIPTPSYLMHYDATSQRVSQLFLPWLASQDKELVAMYDADSYQAVLWALSGEKSSGSAHLLKSARRLTLHPYLRLAMLLRDAPQKKSILENIVQPSDFKNIPVSTTPLKNVVIQTIKQITEPQSNIEVTSKFWRILNEFYPVLQDPYCARILMTNAFDVSNLQHKHQLNLSLDALSNLAHQLKAHDVEKQIAALCDRQRVCAEFLAGSFDEKTSKKIIKNIQDKNAVREHLTLLVDAGLLVYDKITQGVFQHIQSLARSRKINQWVPLKDLIACDFEYYSETCQRAFFRGELLDVAAELGLSIVKIPDARDYMESKTTSQTSRPVISVFSQDNPFSILGVSCADGKPVIMQKVMQLIQQAPQKMAVYRQAQSILFHPAQRFLQHYLRFMVYPQNDDETEVRQSLPRPDMALHDIPFRSEFLNGN